MDSDHSAVKATQNANMITHQLVRPTCTRLYNAHERTQRTTMQLDPYASSEKRKCMCGESLSGGAARTEEKNEPVRLARCL